MRLIFAGTPEFALPSLRALLDAGEEIAAVYTQPDRPAGRGRKLQASPIKQFAMERYLPVRQPLSLKDEVVQVELIAWQADLMIVAAYGLILPQKVLDIPPLGCINVHASLLPRWRGAAPIQRALLAGDEITGITIMQMAAGLDTGPILLRAECPIQPAETADSLHDKLADLGAATLRQALANLPRLTPRPQPAEGVTYAAKIEKSEAQIDWQKSAIVLERKIRAFNSWPIAEATIKNQVFRLWHAEALPETSDLPPGAVLRCTRQGLDVATGKGVLRVLRLQQAGGRVITVSDFLNAHPQWLAS